MGIRHRTAISMIRMQRRQAEANGPRISGPSRTARRVSFSQIDPEAQQHRHRATPLQPQDQDASFQLLQRLRLALRPWTDEKSLASKEYESLQDELQRLSQLKANQQSRTASEIWEDHAAPYRSGSEEPDRLPYRTIKIVTTEPQPIERRDITPLDLSLYRQTFLESPAPARYLTLVPTDEPAVPQAKDLLIDEEAQLGDATANLTQQSLEARTHGKDRIAISPKVALSLLDT
ncbi:hypothetical protein [Oligoflexus tunisiensis]|uniref:hypothetical protein n=1 Tax=Oligoflexus tunisiensis TaxID=708132 RepID=UPI00114CB8CF|nr:hypothetical protein [Oligoflexus tunisiensis]